MAAAMLCGWCHELPWRFECAQCHPRQRLRLCVGCASLWHARGAARSHRLADAGGSARAFRDWEPELRPGASEAQAEGDDGGGLEAAEAPALHESVAADALDAPAEADSAAPAEVDLGDSAAAPASPPAAAPVAPVPSSAAPTASYVAASIAAPAAKGVPVAGSSATLDQAPVVRAAADAAPVLIVQDRVAFEPLVEEAMDIGAKERELKKLVERYCTGDLNAHPRMVELLLRGVLGQDALLCATYHKCSQPVCAHVAKLQRQHMAGKADPEIRREHDRCNEDDQWYFAFMRHMDECVDAMCPFCVHVRIRVSLGSAHAMELMATRLTQQIAMDAPPSDASGVDADQRNFALESRRNNLRQQLLRVEVRREQFVSMGRALAERAQTTKVQGFRYPPFIWHMSDDNFKMNELPSDAKAVAKISVESNDAPESQASTRSMTPPAFTSAEPAESAQATLSQNPTTTVLVGATRSVAVSDTSGAVEDHEDVSMSDLADAPDFGNSIGEPSADDPTADEPGYIDKLLAGKKAAPEDVEVEASFKKALSLGCAIVDAGFCSPSRASRCLLGCQSILMHLKHHVDLQVCSDKMCEAVEHHFAHLSHCKARESNSACEYCLRVQEHEAARAIEALEAEQPEADARAQAVINAMTDSLTDDPPAQREQVIVQLEDELEQVEEEKRTLADKLSAQRLALRHVRRRLELERLPTSGSQRLPLHFIKVLK